MLAKSIISDTVTPTNQRNRTFIFDSFDITPFPNHFEIQPGSLISKYEKLVELFHFGIDNVGSNHQQTKVFQFCRITIVRDCY